jgi:hypothetical protein
MRKSLWIIFTVLLAASADIARADTVTLDVSGSMSFFNNGGGSFCSPSPCALAGAIVINNTTGVVISTDMSGEEPIVGTFTVADPTLSEFTGLTALPINSPTSELTLEFVTPTTGSLVGCTGGQLTPRLTIAIDFFTDGDGPPTEWRLTSGSLTAEITPAPEPSSVALMLAGIGLVTGDAETYRSAPSTGELNAALAVPSAHRWVTTAPSNERIAQCAAGFPLWRICIFLP